MEKIEFKVIEDIIQGKALWEQFSPHKTIDDEWDFRYEFMKYLNFPLQFLVGYKNNEPIGLMPLQKNTGKGLIPPNYTFNYPFLEYFGGDDSDDNTILLKSGYESYADQFLAHISEPAVLSPLQIPLTKNTTHYEDKFTLPLNKVEQPTYENVIDTLFSGEKRKKLRQQMRRLNTKYVINVQYNNPKDIEVLFELNKKRFGSNSSFQHDYRKQILRNFMSLYNVELIGLSVNGVKEGVSYGIHYKDVYYGMNSGVNVDIRDLGKYLILLKIARAVELKCTTYDAGKGSAGWKLEFGFISKPQYRIVLNKE